MSNLREIAYFIELQIYTLFYFNISVSFKMQVKAQINYHYFHYRVWCPENVDAVAQNSKILSEVSEFSISLISHF